MNFYTLTFKRKILLSFLLIFLIIALVDIVLIVVVDRKTTKNFFIDERSSKIKHFKYNDSKKYDIIFVGSSKTFYHISTNIFLKNGISVYNYGVSGAQFEGYPAIISEIADTKPKKVIISLSVNRLYGNLNISKYPTIEEVGYYFNINKYLFFKAFIRYIANLHTFLQYSEPMYYKVKSLYKKFDFKSSSQESFKNRNSEKSPVNYLNLSDCKIFDIKYPSKDSTLLKCTNGDGIIIGSFVGNGKTIQKNKKLKHINEKIVLYLQRMIGRLQNNNISAILILEPIFENKYEYDIKEIEFLFKNIKIVDLTNYRLNKQKWVDDGHLNYKGRKQYSEYLVYLYQNNLL